MAEHLIDTKALQINAQRKKEEKLEKQVQTLQDELEKVRQDSSLNLEDNNDFSNYDILLQVKPEKVAEIKSQIIDGKKYIIIPVEDDEQTNVNGVNKLI